MTDDINWIIAQDEETGRMVRKIKPKRRSRAQPPRDVRPDSAPAIPPTFFEDAFGVGLTVQEADAVRFIYARGIVNIAEIAAFLFDDPKDERDERAKRAHAKVVLSHARAKLEDVGYTIHRPIGGRGLKTSFFYLKPTGGAKHAA